MFAMINANITKRKGAFKTEESCLSLDGVRPCTRYKEIEVDYLEQNFSPNAGSIPAGLLRLFNMSWIMWQES